MSVGASSVLLLVVLASVFLYTSSDVYAEGQGGMLFVAHDHAPSGALDSDGALLKEKLADWLMYAVRIAYYMALLFASGMMLLRLAVPRGEKGTAQRTLMNQWIGLAVKGLFVATLIYVFIHATRLASGIGGGEMIVRVFTETTSGQLWLALIVLSALGLIVAKLPDIGKAVWAILLLAIESFGGHAAASEQAAISILSDFVHLICAALWAGGVMLLLLFWRKDRKEAGRFAERFSSIAWLTIIILILSGILMTWTIIPSWLYLIYTDWGQWLLVKSGLVVGVAAIGAVLRARVRRRELPRGIWIKLDGLLMALIVGIAAIFTVISPMPDGKTLNYHQMGEELHYTLKLSPNAPGPNDASLTVWLPEDEGAPQAIKLILRNMSKPGSPAIDVPLTLVEGGGGIAFPGFNEYQYKAEEVLLPRPGNWMAVITITQASGEQLERELEFTAGN